jgi:hypothetical protein
VLAPGMSGGCAARSIPIRLPSSWPRSLCWSICYVIRSLGRQCTLWNVGPTHVGRMIATAMCVHPTHGVQSASMCVSYMVERERHLYRRHCTWLLCCTYAVLCRAWELWSSTLPVVAQTGACDGARVPNTILSTHVVYHIKGPCQALQTACA